MQENAMQDPDPLTLSHAAAVVLAASAELHQAQVDYQGNPDKAWVIANAFRDATTTLTVWEALTGLEGPEALDYARRVANRNWITTAYVNPF